LSARSVVCLAICAIRLTTLPMAADDSRKRPTLRLASSAAALASSASLLASRTWDPMPCAEWVKLSAAREKVVAVPWAALVCPVSALVRCRMVESVAAVASAPSATEWAARSSCLIMAPSSSSSSSRISLAESLSETAMSAAIVGVAATGVAVGATGSGRRFRNNPNAIGYSQNRLRKPHARIGA